MFSSLLKKSETFENEAQFVVDCIVERPYPRRPLERFAGFEELVQVSVSVTKPIKPLKVVGLSKSVIPKKCYGPGAVSTCRQCLPQPQPCRVVLGVQIQRLPIVICRHLGVDLPQMSIPE